MDPSLALDGEAGVHRVLELLRPELDRAMSYCGVSTPDDINRSFAAVPGQAGWMLQLTGLLLGLPEIVNPNWRIAYCGNENSI